MPAAAEKLIEYGERNPAELRAAQPGNPRIEFDAPGGTFMQRAGASIPATTEGKVAFLERVLGKGNVKTTAQGEILVADPNKPGVLVPFDERQISLKDITADLVGPAIPVAAALPLATANPLSVGAATAGGEAIRIGAAELLTGGNTGQTGGEKVLDIGISALLGTGAQYAVNLGAKVFDALRPHNFAARKVRSALDTPFGRESEQLSVETGIPLSPGEAAGSPSIKMVESFARRTPGGADMMFDWHQTRLATALSGLRGTLDRIQPKDAGSFLVGSDVTKAFDDAISGAMDLRRAQAKIDFGEVHRLSGGQAILPTRNLVGEIQRVIDELDVPGAGDATQSVVAQAKRVRDQLVAPVVDDGTGTLAEGTREVRRLSAEQVERLLEVYTKAQKGTGTLFKDLETSQQRWIAGRLKDAVLRDLDDAGAEAGEAGAIADALTAARDRYKLNSEAINEIGDSTLARLIGNRTRSPEAIAEKFVKMHPSEVREAMTIIEGASPDAARSVRKFFVADAIDKANTNLTARGMTFSEKAFLKHLPDTETMHAAGFTADEIGEIGKVAKVLQRVADKAYEGSPTAFAGIAWDMARAMFTFNPMTMGQAAVAALLPYRLAKAITTPEGRQALLTLAETGPATKKTLGAMTTLQAIFATEPAAQDVRPFREFNDQSMSDVIGAAQ